MFDGFHMQLSCLSNGCIGVTRKGVSLPLLSNGRDRSTAMCILTSVVHFCGCGLIMSVFDCEDVGTQLFKYLESVMKPRWHSLDEFLGYWQLVYEGHSQVVP